MMKTKEKILATALKLFNESNTQAATTNHIAAAMGISPGNLHYHYKNREAIVFSLYEQMQEKTVLEVSNLPENLRELCEHHRTLAVVYWEYRFFHRELLFLLSRDPQLQARYVQDNIAHRKRIVMILEHLMRNGYLLLPYLNVIEYLADTILMYTQFWNPFLETLSLPLDEANIHRIFERIEGALRPWLSPAAIAELGRIEA